VTDLYVGNFHREMEVGIRGFLILYSYKKLRASEGYNSFVRAVCEGQG
jgi:hypothetical protein